MKKNVILMDEIDGMNNGDKGGINTLIKIIRPKKTKKQKSRFTNRMCWMSLPHQGGGGLPGFHQDSVFIDVNR